MLPSNKMKVRKYKMKKLLQKILLCMVLLIACLSFHTTAESSTYKATKYKTFSAVQKDYLTKEWYSDFGLNYAYTNVKTKWGNTKALVICKMGVTADCNETNIFVKHKKKIYRIAHFMGYAYSVSKDRKYIFISGSGAFFMIYHYSGGEYKKYKYIANNGQKTFDNKKKKLLEKYGVNTTDIEYQYISPKNK